MCSQNSRPSDILVRDADCCAVGTGFESRRGHGCLQMHSTFAEWTYSKQPASHKSSRTFQTPKISHSEGLTVVSTKGPIKVMELMMSQRSRSFVWKNIPDWTVRRLCSKASQPLTSLYPTDREEGSGLNNAAPSKAPRRTKDH
ncbi:hypothetical protein TNCV_3255411 [Trichonephila clavipes]|nr:hypothetical protein TNCV_3255411 [Trichonephila clavipes]